MLSARRSAGDGAVGAHGDHGLLPRPQAHLPPRPPPPASPHPPKPPQDPGLGLQVKEEGYIDFLLRASLLLVSKDFPPEVQQHGTKMLQHLLKFRCEELSSADLLSLTLELVGPRREADTSSKTAHPKEQNKYRSSLLMLATNNNWRILAAEETGEVWEYLLSKREQILKDNGETISYHQGMGSLLLVEHNLLCEAFIIATSCSGIQQYSRILPCLLNSLNKIWTQMEWNSKYLRSASGLTRLFSDVQFLNMAYDVVKFCEENLKRSKAGESGACDICSVTLLQSILPLLLQLLQCIHALWNANVVDSGLSEELERAKSSAELAHMLDITDQLDNIDGECFHENDTRALLEGIRHSVEICRFVRKLIELKPYVKGSDCSYDVIKRLKKNSEIPAELSDHHVAPSVNLLLHSVLFFLEPRFHPLIREGHIDILFRTVDRLTKAREGEGPQQLVPDIGHFPLHLQPYACAFVETKLKESMYCSAIEQIRLHEEFDKHLASGELDHRMDEFMSSKDDFVKDLVINEMATTQFLNLDYALIKLSFERRAEIVEIHREVCTYSECLRGLLENESLRGHLKILVKKLETEGFFDTYRDSVNWEKKCFTELVDEFNDKVFAGHLLPKHYAIRGIMDYRLISARKHSSWRDAFEEVVDQVSYRWFQNCEQFWMVTRYYEHLYYDIVRKPLDQVFCVG